MKKILWLCPLLLLMLIFIGCDGKENDDTLGGQLTETTWASEVEKYPFLSNFPAYDGELEVHRYSETFNMLQYIIMDHKCEESIKTNYCNKLISAGFVDKDGYYEKETSKYELTVIVSYSGNTLGLIFSATPIE